MASPAWDREQGCAAKGRGQYGSMVFLSHLHHLQRDRGLLVELTCPLLRACFDLQPDQVSQLLSITHTDLHTELATDLINQGSSPSKWGSLTLLQVYGNSFNLPHFSFISHPFLISQFKSAVQKQHGKFSQYYTQSGASSTSLRLTVWELECVA